MYTVEYLTRNRNRKSDQFETRSEAFYFALYLAEYGARVSRISDGEGSTVFGFSDLLVIHHCMLKVAAKYHAEEIDK